MLKYSEKERETDRDRDGETERQRQSEREMSSFSTEDKNKSSSNESIILDFSKLKPYDLEPVCESRMFLSESELASEAEEQGRSGTHTGVNAVNASIWLYGYLYGKLVLSER